MVTQATERSSPPPTKNRKGRKGVLRALGLGLIAGAADDDPSAIGTYASAGAALGPSILWMAPATFPMMFAVVYLSSKLGQVSGKGLFAVVKAHYPRWIVYPALIGVVMGNTIEAAADIGGMAAALGIFVRIPIGWIAVGTAIVLLALQILGSYRLIRNVFRWLALSLVAYVGAAILAKPELRAVVRGTFIPTIRFDREFLSMVVAILGTTLSAYLYTWQSNQEVEEKIAMGRTRLPQRKGASEQELRESRKDIGLGMLFSNLVMYFIILATASTLFKAGTKDISTAADAAKALEPLAGHGAGVLFSAGIIAVGFLAVPVMTTGAAYDVAQSVGWPHGLHAKPRQARNFYLLIVGFTAIAVVLNFLGFNPMKALVWSGVVQGFSTPPLMLLIMLLTRKRSLMGERVNTRAVNALGWITTVVTFSATAGLVVTWFI